MTTAPDLTPIEKLAAVCKKLLGRKWEPHQVGDSCSTDYVIVLVDDEIDDMAELDLNTIGRLIGRMSGERQRRYDLFMYQECLEYDTDGVSVIGRSHAQRQGSELLLRPIPDHIHAIWRALGEPR